MPIGKYKVTQIGSLSRREESFNARCESIERNRSQTYAEALQADEQTPAIQVRFGSERAKGKLKQGPKIRVKRGTSWSEITRRQKGKRNGAVSLSSVACLAPSRDDRAACFPDFVVTRSVISHLAAKSRTRAEMIRHT